MKLKGRKQQKNLGQPSLFSNVTGEAPIVVGGGSELSEALTRLEDPTPTLMDQICSPENLDLAMKKVMQNKGAPGVDGMRTDALADYWDRFGAMVITSLRNGTYRPSPVKRVEIPKPGGGVRLLGIPTVLDRMIQQAILQVLQPLLDPTMSPNSYGFRPGRSQHDAVEKARSYIAEGYTYIVDMDIEKFFDHVHHDILMHRLGDQVRDKGVLRLIGSYLRSGVLVGGLVEITAKGTPQGGPLSPFLSNIYLDVLDKELDRRGLRYVRYADDCNIYVRSSRSGERVLASVDRFLEKKLRLRLNLSKSRVVPSGECEFLGFTFLRSHHHPKVPKLGISKRAKARFKSRVRELTRRGHSSLEEVSSSLGRYLRGWFAYYGKSEFRRPIEDLLGWSRRCLRCVIWVTWGNARSRLSHLVERGVSRGVALRHAYSARGPWRSSQTKAIQIALPNKYLGELMQFDMSKALTSINQRRVTV